MGKPRGGRCRWVRAFSSLRSKHAAPSARGEHAEPPVSSAVPRVQSAWHRSAPAGTASESHLCFAWSLGLACYGFRLSSAESSECALTAARHCGTRTDGFPFADDFEPFREGMDRRNSHGDRSVPRAVVLTPTQHLHACFKSSRSISCVWGRCPCAGSSFCCASASAVACPPRQTLDPKPRLTPNPTSCTFFQQIDHGDLTHSNDRTGGEAFRHTAAATSHPLIYSKLS